MKRVKRFLSVLCCMVLIVSMTVDVYAAEKISSLLTKTEDDVLQGETQESKESSEVGTETEDALSETKTEEESDREDDVLQSETQESKESSEVGTETEDALSETKMEEESDREETQSTEIQSRIETEESNEREDETKYNAGEGEESPTETETDTNIEEETTEEEKVLNEVDNSADAPVAVNNIFDDAFVSYFEESQKSTIFAESSSNKSGRLILGKQRYIYFRFDLSSIDANAEKIELQCTLQFDRNATATEVIVNECSEYLSNNGSGETTEKWTEDNINYNNRPVVQEAEIQKVSWPDSTSASQKIDLTDFIKKKIEDNAETACIRITTAEVDNRDFAAMEFYSSRDTTDANKPVLHVTPAKLSVNNIFDDAVVRSDQSDTVYNTEKKLTIGKRRHVYLRFDLSDIDPNSEKIEFQGTFVGTASKVGEKTIVVTESNEYLRKSASESGTEKWTMENITYNNRPLDTDNVICDNLKWSSGNVVIDLTEFIKGKIASGEKTACIHITTATVDTEDTAIDLASSHTDQGEAKKPKLVAAPAVKPSVNGIFDDAYVSSQDADANKRDSTTLIFGKYRHFYIRFDLSNISADADSILFRGTYAKGTRESVVVYECGENLRKTDNTDSGEKWTTDNITYNNRPIDESTALYEAMPWPNSKTNLEIDLTEFIKKKIEAGAKTACIHVTTTKVDSEQSAVEVYSTRSDSGKPRLIVSNPNDEKPVEVVREIDGNDYYDNGYLIQKVIKIKTSDNQYLKVETDGTVTTTDQSDEAGLFGLHIYQYDKFDRESYGATKTTCAFENLETGKFLTIQNYFAESDSSKAYYNLTDKEYFIKATAPDVNWNERFDVKLYPDSKYYVISSHLQVYRDGSDAVSPLYIEKNALKCGKSEDAFQFFFEEVENQDKLKVLQEVNGKSVQLFWKPVNGDKETANYTITGQTVSYDTQKDMLYTEISNLSVGLHEFTVAYAGQQETVEVRIFNHLALAHSQEQLDAMKEHVAKKEEPWYSDYQKLLNQVPYNMADSSFEVSAQEGVGRGDPAGHGNIGAFERSSNAAYFNALQWVITGEEQYAQKGVEILNAWANTLKIVDGRDRILGAAISTYRMNNAAEILKYYHGGYSGYSDADFKKYQDMLLNVIYPVVQDLGLPMKANGNWDTAAMAAMVTIGAICDNTEIFERAVYLYQDIHTNGSISVYVSEWGQSVESYRDQAHAQLGISYLADVCETAEKQGIDLYSLYDNRLAKGFNWAAQYNLYNTDNLKMAPLTDVFEQTKWKKVDSEKINRGELRSVYELPLAHYSKVGGVDVTWMQKAAEAMRPQGYVNNDHLNFGTLTTYNGEPTEEVSPYFQLRTRLEPWYQRTWNDAEKYGAIENDIPETLNSYFAVDKTGNVTVSSKKADAPFFQMENQGDGTYAIRCVKTNKYLSVKEEAYCDGNAIKADAATVGDHEKFVLKGTGASFYYLEAPAFENRILNVNVENENDPASAVLTLYLGTRITNESDSISNNERYILVYNTKDVALEGITLADASELENYINSLPEINNDDNKYTAESYQAYTEKLNAAKACVQDAEAGKLSQAEIDDALQSLKDAYENLELSKPVEELTVSAPRADKESGEVLAGTKITLICETEGADIYYTTDKSNPGKDNGTLYETPISVNEDMIIKAVAVKDGYKDSEIVTYEYTISKTEPEKFVYAPTADIPSGKVEKGTKITLTCETEGAEIYYTTDESDPGKDNGTLYENPIPVNEDTTIRAVAVKDGYKDSEIVTYKYTVSETEQEKFVYAPTADRDSGTEIMFKGTKISLKSETEGASIYYTTDGSDPSVSNGELYKNPIPVYKDMTIKAIAVKEDISSEIKTFTYTISIGLKIIVDGNAYNCSVGDAIDTNAAYVYTGSAVMPDITVVNNGELLKKGIDYTVKYANNTKVPAANAKNAQRPKITVTGKNNLKGNAVLYFTINAKSIANLEEGISAIDPLVVAENKKATPTLYYGGQMLKANRDFTLAPTDNRKLTAVDNNCDITLTGIGNYTGTRKIKVNVVGKNDLQKFVVKLDDTMSNIVFDGKAHEPVFAIYNTKDAEKKQLTEDNYYVVAASDAVNAGTKKFTVVGTGIYTGCKVTKSYKIKPCTDSSSIRIDKNGLKKEYSYTKTGVVFAENELIITGSGCTLKEGKDYKITYSGNKKVTDRAKYNVTFLGNYKGVKNVENQTGTFKIAAADLSMQNWKAVALDKVYKKPGNYKTKLYVSVDHVLLKASDYTVTYEFSNGEMTGKNKLDLGEKTEATVTIKIQGRGNYTGTIETSYKVRKVEENLLDLSKARVTVVGSDGKKLKNVQFDGNEKLPELKIEVKDGRKYKEITSEEYSALKPYIKYVNNLYKGKASVVINGDGKKFVGSKAVTFSIVSKDITTTK